MMHANTYRNVDTWFMLIYISFYVEQTNHTAGEVQDKVERYTDSVCGIVRGRVLKCYFDVRGNLK